MAIATPTQTRRYRSAITVTGWTVFFMVLLRVAIGWHFFYEGYYKVRPAEGKFSATPYLQASVGPFSGIFHGMVDDMSGLEKRLTSKEYMYGRLEEKLNIILKHYGIEGDSGYQNKKAVDDLQKKANGGLTDAQLAWINADLITQTNKANALQAQAAKQPLTADQTEDLQRASRKVANYTEELAKAQATRQTLSATEQAALAAEARKLTKEQVESLRLFVKRKMHGVPDDATLVKLFDDETLFKKEIRYAGEYVKPNAPDQTDFLTEVVVTPIAEKRDAIIGKIKAMIDDLDEHVRQGVLDESLADNLTPANRLAQLELLKKELPPAQIVPEGTAPDEVSWITHEYVLGKVGPNRMVLKPGLLDKRYDQLRRAYDLTDRQHQSRYGWRYRDQKKLGHHDLNNVDAIESDPDFVNALNDYRKLVEQVKEEQAIVADLTVPEETAGSDKPANASFKDQRLAFNIKKRDSLRSKLLTRVEAPLGDLDLAKMQDFGEYIGPIKAMTAAQFSVGPVPSNIYPLEFPGKQLTQLGVNLPKMTLTYRYDIAMMLGLLAVGTCLILGLFTRFAAVCGAAMLLMFYLAMPPFPGVHVPENAAEGHYLFVNKNLIEMVALLMIAFSGVGRWFGIDGIIHAVFGRRRTEIVEATAPLGTVSAPSQGRVYIPEPRTTTRDGNRG